MTNWAPVNLLRQHFLIQSLLSDDAETKGTAYSLWETLVKSDHMYKEQNWLVDKIAQSKKYSQYIVILLQRLDLPWKKIDAPSN